MELGQIFSNLWREYSALTPLAERVRGLIRARGEEVRNDHIALRTFDLRGMDLPSLARVFTDRGYALTGEYDFSTKGLNAASYSHGGGQYPRVFISEFRTENLRAPLREALSEAIANPEGDPLSWFDGRCPWPQIDRALYTRLQEVSEYAAWVAVHGIRANHFTVAFNALSGFQDLSELNHFLVANGVSLCESGGVIKGSAAQMLEQSSTLADRALITFACGQTRDVPTCYYEFARRYPDPATGSLFDRFIAESAKHIFDSTNEVI